MTNTPTPAFSFRKVILSGAESELLAMDEEGCVTAYSSPLAAVRAIKRRDNSAAKRGESTVTLIEWRDMPEDFVPPVPA